jgi:hypothetical protein
MRQHVSRGFILPIAPLQRARALQRLANVECQRVYGIIDAHRSFPVPSLRSRPRSPPAEARPSVRGRHRDGSQDERTNIMTADNWPEQMLAEENAAANIFLCQNNSAPHSKPRASPRSPSNTTAKATA